MTSTLENDSSEVQEQVWAEAVEGSVGRSLSYSTTVIQPVEPLAVNGLSGVVTATSPGEVAAGQSIYVVGETPVRVIDGEQPFWRDLAIGAAGKDVEMLQRLLKTLGHRAGEPNGRFDAATETAVNAWQRSEGRTQTGVVQLGELVALPKLPIEVSLGKDIRVGNRLSGGEDAVLASTGSREFVLQLTQDQAKLVPAEASVEISFEEYTWTALIGGSRIDENGHSVFTLTGVDGGEVCADQCGALPADPQLTLRSRVIVVPEVTGVSIPAAAVNIDADGASYVITDSGKTVVEVVASGQGIVIVNGLNSGTRVLLGQAEGHESATQPTPSATQES